MSLFGWSIIRESELKRLQDCDVKIQKFWQVHRWFSGWQDLDIIWHYLVEDTNFGGIELARKEYAKARGTNEYGSPKPLEESE